MSAPGPVRVVTVRAPAKINLHLGVGPLRADDYHELTTIFHAVTLADEIVASRADGISIEVLGAADLPLDERNLAWQAAAALAARAGVPADVHLTISKRIPVAGGMAGGSADAAGALLACARLWSVPTEDLRGIAAGIGSDVAFPLLGGTALGTGRGEVLTPLACAVDLHWVLATVPFGISAGAAYRTLDDLRAAGRAPVPAGPPDRLVAALAAGDVDAIAAGLVNDLQPAACELAPVLLDTLAAGTRYGALAGVVCGSGPTCAFLVRDRASAAELSAGLRSTGLATVETSGPADGATVLH